MIMPYVIQTQKTTRCEICGADTTGTGRTVCYYCEVETTPEVRELMRRKRINVPDV